MRRKQFSLPRSKGTIKRGLRQLYAAIMFTLKADELGPLRPTVLLQPVRVNEPWSIIVRMFTDVLQERIFGIHPQPLKKVSVAASLRCSKPHCERHPSQQQQG